MSSALKQLIGIAKARMEASLDPIHDLAHTKRVVRNVQALGQQLDLARTQKDALIIAAWWHDVSRTLNKKSSFIWMPLIDDTWSAFLLWREISRSRLSSSVSGLATRLIFCKSFGTGEILTRLLVRKRNRLLVHALNDADVLDALSIERVAQVITLAESSRIYHAGYRVLIRWYGSRRHVRVKTPSASSYLAEKFTALWDWITEDDRLDWHIEQFGEYWVAKHMARGEILLERVTTSA